MARKRKFGKSRVETLESGRVVLHVGGIQVKPRDELCVRCMLMNKPKVHTPKKFKGEKHKKDYRTEDW